VGKPRANGTNSTRADEMAASQVVRQQPESEDQSTLKIPGQIPARRVPWRSSRRMEMRQRSSVLRRSTHRRFRSEDDYNIPGADGSTKRMGRYLEENQEERNEVQIVPTRLNEWNQGSNDAQDVMNTIAADTRATKKKLATQADS
jgi:hypothetical protein